MIGKILGSFIIIIIGFSLLPTISNSVNLATNLATNCSMNASSYASSSQKMASELNVSHSKFGHPKFGSSNEKTEGIKQEGVESTTSSSASSSTSFSGASNSMSLFDLFGMTTHNNPSPQQSSECSPILTSANSWGYTVLQLVPGFFALGLLGVGIAMSFSAFRSAGLT